MPNGIELKKKPANRKPKPPKPSGEKYLCYCCGEKKKKTDFYTNNDPFLSVKVTTVCKACAEKIARRWNPRTEAFGDCTKASISEALKLLNKPFLLKLWDGSVTELNEQGEQSGRKLTNLWAAYISRVSLPSFKGLTYEDGDTFEVFKAKAEALAPTERRKETDKSREIYQSYERNRDDVCNLIGYDCFADEAEEDKPMLYSQLLSYLDLGGDNEDAMRVSSAITIVRGFLQQAKIDNMIASCMKNINSEGKAGEIKSLLDSKQKISSTISTLAEQSCISLKHNKNATKGENTWAGKLKKLRELNLREFENNSFDIDTVAGMRQVADISNASIIQQLHLAEDETFDMIAQQRDMIYKLQESVDKKEELSRILMRENYELKEYLKSKDIDITKFTEKTDLTRFSENNGIVIDDSAVEENDEVDDDNDGGELDE